MPEERFEQYLDQLRQTMRLSASQRRAIAAELRDHLELRLDEMHKLGIEKQAAIELALAEFGEAHDLAHALAQPRQQRQRRHLMQTIAATAAVTGLAATLAFFTADHDADQPADQPAVVQQPVEPAAAPRPAVQVVNDAERAVQTDRFALNDDLYFLTRSETKLDRPDGESLSALTAYGLRFSDEPPNGVSKIQALAFGHAGNPYTVHVPDAIRERLWATQPDAPQAEQTDKGQPLYAVLSTIGTELRKGRFTVTVRLYNATDRLIGEQQAAVSTTATFWSRDDLRNHAIQKHLLVFDGRDGWGDAARFEVAIHEDEVVLPEAQAQLGADEEAEDEPVAVDEPARWPGLELTSSSRQAEMRALTLAIDELNKSMDEHRRFFEAALADPGIATERERERAVWKMHSIQQLRAKLEAQVVSFMLSC